MMPPSSRVRRTGPLVRRGWRPLIEALVWTVVVEVAFTFTEHGTGMIHLAQRRDQGAFITDMQYRFGGSLANVMAKRIGLEKHGDSIAIYISLEGEPMHQFGPPITLHFEEPFYVGIGFCSHLPATSDTAVVSNVLLENSAGNVR